MKISNNQQIIGKYPIISSHTYDLLQLWPKAGKTKNLNKLKLNRNSVHERAREEREGEKPTRTNLHTHTHTHTHTPALAVALRFSIHFLLETTAQLSPK